MNEIPADLLHAYRRAAAEGPFTALDRRILELATRRRQLRRRWQCALPLAAGLAAAAIVLLIPRIPGAGPVQESLRTAGLHEGASQLALLDAGHLQFAGWFEEGGGQ